MTILKFFRVVQVIGLIFISTSALAESVDLKTIISETFQQSPVVKKAEAVHEELYWKKIESYQGYMPSLTGSINYLTQERYMLVDVNLGAGPASIAQVVPTTLYTLTANWPLFDGFATAYRIKSASKQEQASQKEFEWAQFATQRQVVLQFYKALAAEALKEVSEQNLLTLTDHLKDVQALNKAGISTSYDILRVEVQVSEAKSEVLNANDNFEMAKFRLGEVMGKTVETRNLAGKLPDLSNVKIENLAPSTQRQDLQALRERADSMGDLSTSAHLYWVPKISAFGQYQYYNNKNDRFSDSEAFREAYLVGLNLTWNLFDGFSSVAKSRSAAAQAMQFEKNYESIRLKAEQDLEFWKRKFNYFKTVYSSRVTEVQKSAEAVRIAKEGRRAGARTTTDLLDAELDLFRSRAGQVNAQIGAVEALINLEMATQSSLYEFN